jgi:hypothetical protein
MSLKEKLAKSAEKAVQQKAERRAKTIPGSHLVEQFRKLAKDAGLTERESTSQYIITGRNGNKRRVAVEKRGGKIHLLGFSVHAKAVRQVPREEAKQKHYGHVFGEFLFDKPDELILEAYRAALVEVDAVVEEKKPAKTPKAPKAEAKPAEPTPTVDPAAIPAAAAESTVQPYPWGAPLRRREAPTGASRLCPESISTLCALSFLTATGS